ncbi:MAG: hypothetical protein RL385_2764 [Pseudomonadota bacterium]|jgi:hypothetical protein
MLAIEAFLTQIDVRWAPAAAGQRQTIPIFGASALMLATNYLRATKDSDVLQTSALDKTAATQLLTLAGRGTQLAVKHGLYVEVLPEAYPFLPQKPCWNRIEFTPALKHLHIDVLDVVDIVVSKLRRFHGSDVDDIEAMIERGLVTHDTLIERFRSAFDVALYNADAEKRPSIVKNLNRIERDSLGEEPTAFEYPSWADNRE